MHVTFDKRRHLATLCMSVKSLQLCPTLCDPWTLSMGFSRQEYWSGLPSSLPGNLPVPGIGPTSLMSPVLSGRFFSTSATWEAPGNFINVD